ncbi:hypothetical protein EFP19_20870 [Burkholderia glumae]|nr:hypothetical protein EFP19_20870 [Burkholderia glumae]
MRAGCTSLGPPAPGAWRTCTKRTRMSEKAKKASEFINRLKIRTTRIEPSAKEPVKPAQRPCRAGVWRQRRPPVRDRVVPPHATFWRNA